MNNPVHLPVLSDTYRANNFKESILVFTKKNVIDEGLMEQYGQDSSFIDHQTVQERIRSESKLKVALQKNMYGTFQLQTLYWSPKKIGTCFVG